MVKLSEVEIVELKKAFDAIYCAVIARMIEYEEDLNTAAIKVICKEK